jgi:CubicO group peptidase (beta-lactamase class C family)
MHGTRRQILAGVAAAVAVSPFKVSAQGGKAAVPAAHPRASKLARKLFAGNPAPALSLAVARSKGIVWAEALGHANLEHDVAASPRHSFPLGSVSKVLTATAAARLVSRGVLDLDAPISGWLPDLPAHHRNTTLRQLLTHRGGVRHYGAKDLDPNGPGGAIYMRVYPSAREVMALFVDDALAAPVGSQVIYSSYGYTLASLAMQAAAGVEFRALIAAEIGKAFRLDSLVPEDPWAVLPLRASRYMNERDVSLLYDAVPEEARPRLTAGVANVPLSNPAYSWAGAGFLMTPSDTAKFGAAMLEGPNTRISAAERSLLFTPMTEKTPKSPPLGLGWRIDSDGKGRLRWRHEGATPGGRFSLVVYPKLDLAVAMAGNVMAMPLDVGKASSDLADAFA